MRLNVRPQDNISLGDFAPDMLRREAEERRLRRPLDRDAVIFNLSKAGDAAASGNAHATVMYLSRIVEPEDTHGCHGKARDLHLETQALSGRFTDALSRSEAPHLTIARRLRALLTEVEADRFADRAPRAIIAEAVDRLGAQTVLAAAEVDTFQVRAGIPPDERPAKSWRTLHQAAVRLLDTQTAEAA